LVQLIEQWVACFVTVNIMAAILHAKTT